MCRCGLLVDDAPRDDRPATLERRAQRLEPFRFSLRLRLQVFELGRALPPRGRPAANFMAGRPRPAARARPGRTGSRDRPPPGASRASCPGAPGRRRRPASASSPLHENFVRGHSPKPPAPGLYGSSWHAPKRLGSESGVPHEQPAVEQKRLRLVERLERPLRDEAALEVAARLELRDRRHRVLILVRCLGPRSSRSATSSSRATPRTRTAAGSPGGSPRSAWRSR